MTSGKSGKLLGHFEYKKDDAEGAERKGRAMATKILEKIQEIRGENALLGIMSDSTNENTGWENGAIWCLEEKMGKNLFWLVCSLHTLERQLRWRLNNKHNNRNSFFKSQSLLKVSFFLQCCYQTFSWRHDRPQDLDRGHWGTDGHSH